MADLLSQITQANITANALREKTLNQSIVTELSPFLSKPEDWQLAQNKLNQIKAGLEADKNALTALKTQYSNLLSQYNLASPEEKAAIDAAGDLKRLKGNIDITQSNISSNESTANRYTSLINQNKSAAEALGRDPTIVPPTNGTVQTTTSSIVTTTAGGVIQDTRARPTTTATSVTNTGTSAIATAEKYADPQNIDIKVDEITTDEIPNVSFPDESLDNAPSSVPQNPVPAFARFKNADRRVRLIVPESYLSGPAAGPPAGNTNRGVLSLNGGIVFPYTPSISYEQSANYNTVNAMHSNFTQYFYKNSGVGEISLTAKFTVQNSFEAATLLAVQHLCRALVKMPFGDDANAGSPPPVCRLMAYGDYQLEGTPVAIRSYKMDLPDTVDYFVVDKKYGYGTTSVPVSTVITLMLVPLYSRQEQLQFSVEKWLTGNQRIQGYL